MRKKLQLIGLIIISLNLMICFHFIFTRKSINNHKVVKLTSSKIFYCGNSVLEANEKLPNDKMSVCKIISDKRKDPIAIQFLVNNIDQSFFCDERLHFDCEPTAIEERLIEIGSDSIPYLSASLLTSDDQNIRRVNLYTLKKIALTYSKNSVYRKQIIEVFQKAMLIESDIC